MQPFVIKRKTDFKYVRLIDVSNAFIEKVFVGDARDKAKDAGLDLVCFNLPERDKFALCKIIDYGKWKYYNEKTKKKDQSSNKQAVKEVRFSPVIGDHDVEHKLKQVFEFLENGDEVLFSMRFKGVQKRNFRIGEDRMNEIVDMCQGRGEVVHRKRTGSQIMVRLKQAKEKK